MKLKKDLTAGTYEGEEVPKLTKWVYSVSGMFRDACYSLVSGFLLTYIMYSGVLGPTTEDYNAQIAVINALFIVFLIWDGINDPLFGMILEKCHFKSGKFRPWILIGGILNAIIVGLLFTVRPTGWAFVIFWAIFYFLWDGVFTLNDIAYWAMLPAMSSSEKVRAKITTLMGIFVSIGTFVMYGLCSILPGAKNYTYIYAWIAIPTVILFAASQIAIFFLCKEKKRDPKQDEISEKTKFKDLFTVLGKNKPLRTVVIALLFYTIGSTLMVGIGVTYFYIIYGYGGQLGGIVMTLFTVCYALGSLGAQGFFGAIVRKFKKQNILTVSALVSVIAYVVFFIVGVPLFGNQPLATSSGTGLSFALGGTMFLNYIPTIIFFGAQQIFYLTLLIDFQNTIEYNEWKFGERKESVIFSWRPLDVKVGSAIQKGIIYLTLLTSGLYDMVISQISGAEQAMAQSISNNPDSAAEAEATAQSTIDALINNNVSQSSKIILGACMIGSMVICMIIAWAVMHYGYKIDEKQYDDIVKELEVRRKADAEAMANKPTVAVASASNNPPSSH
jgi:melibiose permease/lactose/raffinose/galactose permease